MISAHETLIVTVCPMGRRLYLFIPIKSYRESKISFSGARNILIKKRCIINLASSPPSPPSLAPVFYYLFYKRAAFLYATERRIVSSRKREKETNLDIIRTHPRFN